MLASLLCATFATTAATALPATAASAASATPAARTSPAHVTDSPGPIATGDLISTAGLTTPVDLATPAGALAATLATTGEITGVVRGADGPALTRACVTVNGPRGTVSGLTRAGGRYAIGGLRPGAYTVGYSACADPGRYFDQWYGGASLATAAAQVLVAAGQPTRLAPVTLRLTSPAAAVAAAEHALRAGPAGPAAAKGSELSGIVASKSGKRLAGLCVLESMTTANEAAFGGTSTGRRGGYSMPIGTSGKWEVQFSGGCGNTGNYAPQWWRYASTGKKATYLHARRGRSFRGIDASLRPGAAISGTVRAAAGARPPLAGACVDAAGLGAMSQVEVQAVTRANGSYVLKGLGTGRYRVQFAPGCGLQGNYLSASYGRIISVRDGKTVTGINGFLRLGGKISGVVTSQASRKPLAGICVLLNGGESGSVGFTSATGTYSFGRLQPGRYTVAFFGGCGSSGSYAPQYYDAQANALAAIPVTVSAGQVRSGIDAAMLAGGTVTGRVTSPAGAPLHGVCVSLTSRNEAGGLGQNLDLELETVAFFSSFSFSSGSTVSGRTGQYAIRNLAPGLYSADFLGGCGGGTARYAAQAFAPLGGTGSTWVTVSAGIATAGVSTVLRPGGSISGVITGSAGGRLSGICAVATTGVVTPASVFTELGGAAMSRRGAYRIIGLATGRYAVEFTPCEDQPYADQWYRGQANQASARRVAVRAGHATTRIDAALTSGGRITGRVRSGISGRPVAGACVLVVDPRGNVVASGSSGKSGQYHVAHVPAGRWQLDTSLCETASPRLAGIVRRGVRIRDTATTATASMTLPRAGRIAGEVLGGSLAAAQPGICVELTPKAGDGQATTAVTGANGRYTVAGLAPGRYQVLFTPLCLFGTAALVPQWFSGQPTRAAATPVTVTAGRTTTSVGGSLASGGGISGTVTVSGAAAAAGVCAGAFTGAGATPAAIAITGADGSYQISGLSPGTYRVEFSAGCGVARYTTQWYSGATSRAGAAPVTVTAGAVHAGIGAS
jgi:protocatechuate 3,4-dioxygenase beta subunit